MKKTLLKTVAFLPCVFGALNAKAADMRACETRTKDQQVLVATSFLSRYQQNDPNAGRSSSLVKEVFFGHAQAVQEALKAGADPNATLDTGVGYTLTLLEVAAIACQPSVGALLINNGADVNGNGASTPLVTAAENGMDHLVEVLLRNGANPEKEDFSGDTALREAVAQGHYSTVKILLENHANPNHANSGGEPVLGENSTDPNDVKIAGLLRQYGAISK